MRKRIAAIALAAVPAAAMLSFSAFWRPTRAPEPSDPSGKLSADEFRALLGVIATYFELRNRRAAIEGGELVVEGPEGRSRYALQGLVEECCRQSQDVWPQVVGRYFAEAEPAPPSAPAAARPSAAGPTQGVGAGAPKPPPRLRPIEGPVWPQPRGTGAGEAPPPGREEPNAPAGAGPGAGATPAAGLPPSPAAPEAVGARAGEDWAAFKVVVQRCFRRHGFDAVVEAEGVVAIGGAGQELRFEAPGLEGVAQELPREQWARFVDSYFGEPLRRLRAAEAFAAKRPPEPGSALAGRSWSEVRELLAIELLAPTALSDEEREEAIYSDEVPGLLSAVVCCLPGSTVCLQAGMLRQWGVAPEEAFAAALENLRRRRRRGERAGFGPGLEGMRLEADDACVAAQALLLGEDPECSGEHGTLVALPRKGLLLACPLRPVPDADAAVSEALMSLVECILECERGGQPLLTRKLFWYHDGVFTELPYQVLAGQGSPSAELYPPPAFLAMLEDLRRS